MDQKQLTAALRHLRKDARLAAAMQRLPRPQRRSRLSTYEALVRSIIYQQISGKAARTVLERFCGLYPGRGYPKPETVLATPIETLRSAGLSRQKASYILDLSQKFVDGTIRPRRFRSMSDDEIRAHLTAVKGIGTWSADVFMMFTLHRPDVFPTGDLGIQKGLQRLYGLSALPRPAEMEHLSTPWRPHRTVACWYLWRLADEGNSNR